MCYEIALMWMSQNLTDEKSTLARIMAGVARQQANTRANVDPDLCRQTASLGHNKSIPLWNHILRRNCEESTGPRYLFWMSGIRSWNMQRFVKCYLEPLLNWVPRCSATKEWFWKMHNYRWEMVIICSDNGSLLILWQPIIYSVQGYHL